MRRTVTGLIALALVLPACRDERDVIRVGAKGFAEQQVLAHMLAELVRKSGLEVRVVPCGDTWACQTALREGRLDLMVDYTGTGLAFAGSPRPDRTDPVAQLDALYAPRDLRWLIPLGFDNGYRVLVRTDRGAAHGLKTIGDLDTLKGGVRLACPPEYKRRPGDGLAALLRRYGLELNGPVLSIDDPTERYRALSDGRVDAVVGYATDGETVGLGLTTLADDDGFFPPYLATIVARRQTLERHGSLAGALDVLRGRVDAAAVRQLNYAATVEARPAAQIARGYLVGLGLIKAADERSTGGPPLRVLYREGDNLGDMAAQSVRAVRQVFPRRTVTLTADEDPIAAVAVGRARLVALGAESFFDDDGTREGRIEAVAVLGTRMVHVLRRRGAAGDPFSGRLGAPPSADGAGEIADAIASRSSVTYALRDTTPALLAALLTDRLDGVVIAAPPGNAAIGAALEKGGVQAVPVADWLTPQRSKALPWLRHVRIPAGTYPGQSESIETLAAQVVLAGPASGATRGALHDGPAGASPTRGVALTRAQAIELSEAIGVPEAPDPTLPSAWMPGSGGPPASDSMWADITDTTLNWLTIAFLIWLGLSVARRRQDG